MILVPEAPPSPERREAIASLLDDPSEAVRNGLLGYFASSGESSREMLRAIMEGSNRIAAIHARWYLLELSHADPANEFREFIRSLGYELETGALLMSRTVYPELEVADVCRQLDRLANRCRELIMEDLSPHAKCRVLNRVLFHEFGFRGNVDDYTNPENSFLHRVLESRKGLPISLAILYLLVADRCGVRVEPVGLPGHFMVGCYEEREPFFIDVFDRGRFLTANDLATFLEKQGIQPEDFHLTPTTVREVLCRCCRNLANHYATSGSPPMARLFASFVDEFETTYEQHQSP